jgi:ATP-dependent Clp protease ATP-binding subunit ClpA
MHVGLEHVLLALVAPDETSVAAVALRKSGADYDAMRGAAAQQTENGVARRGPRPRSKGMSPSWYTLVGRVDAFAVALGANRIEPEHLLLSLLWEPNGSHAYLLTKVGATRRKVYRNLSKLGVATPKSPPPPEDDTRWGAYATVRVPGGQAWELASFVRKQLPEGAPFGFNFNTTHAWFHSGDDIDLLPLVRKARRQQMAQRRRSDSMNQPTPPRTP